MEILGREREVERRIGEFDSRGAFARAVGSGAGEAHVYEVRFEAGGSIGRHVAGFDQLFVVIEGEGWAAGEDGVVRTLRRGDIARFRRGEMHAKGSGTGMKALMIQVEQLDGESGRS